MNVSAMLVQWTGRIGEPLYQYQAPTGYPDTAESWVNTGALLNRLNFSLALAGNRLPGVRVDTAALLRGAQPGDSKAALDKAIEVLLGGQVSPETRRTLESRLSDPQIVQASLDDPDPRDQSAAWSQGWCWARRNFSVAEFAVRAHQRKGELRMNVSRRAFLKSGGVAMIGMSTLPAFLMRAVAAAPAAGRKKLVVVFQRGAADGLNIVVPFAEPNYYSVRPSIAIPSPRRGGEGCRDRPRRIFWPASQPGAAAAACFRSSNWPSCMPWARRIPPVRILTRRTTWNRARRASSPPTTAG